MRAYAMGEASAELVELNAQLSDDFTLRFFGRKAPKLPTVQMLDFENRWRAVHANGPKTKGSVVFRDYEMK